MTTPGTAADGDDDPTRLDALTAAVGALADRVRLLEDQLALYQLVASYGPSADAGDADATSSLWTDDGVYETEQTGPIEGRTAIADMIDGPGHRGLLEEGCGHVLSMPVVDIDGDRATLTNHSHLFRRREAGYDLWLLKANKWEVERTPDGWRVRRRINLTLDGSDAPRDLLRRRLDS